MLIRDVPKSYFQHIGSPLKLAKESKKHILLTALAILSCLTVIIPVGMGIAYALLGRVKQNAPANPCISRSVAGTLNPNPSVRESSSTSQSVSNSQRINEGIEEALNATPKFKFYQVTPHTPVPGIPQFTITSVTRRPVNFLFRALGIKANNPGSRGGSTIRFRESFEKVREKILGSDDQEVVDVKALSNEKINVFRDRSDSHPQQVDEREIFGDKVFQIRRGELKDLVNSQQIFLSPTLPREFYLGVQEALKKDNMLELPYNRDQGDREPIYFSDLLKPEVAIPYPNLKAFVASVFDDNAQYGFDEDSFESFRHLTLYEIGAMSVRRQDVKLMVDENLQIRERAPDANDSIRLLDISGIRSFSYSQTTHEVHKDIMTNTFKTALQAACGGFLVMPAIGMGVWRGHPEVYWNALFTAVAESEMDFDRIFINPGHQRTYGGQYDGASGGEFAGMLSAFMENSNEVQKAKLSKIFNLYDPVNGKDILQLAHQLKVKFPDKTVSIANASDPDDTIGRLTGQYAFNMCHPHTTEENYANLTTSALCFKDITEVNNHEDRVISV